MDHNLSSKGCDSLWSGPCLLPWPCFSHQSPCSFIPIFLLGLELFKLVLPLGRFWNFWHLWLELYSQVLSLRSQSTVSTIWFSFVSTYLNLYYLFVCMDFFVYFYNVRIPIAGRTGGMSQVVEHLLCRCDTLSSTSSPTYTKKMIQLKKGCHNRWLTYEMVGKEEACAEIRTYSSLDWLESYK